MKDHKLFATISLALATVFLWVGLAAAEPPLLVPGKSTIYQRVIVHPGAYEYSQPDAPRGDAIEPFTVLYIYETREVNGVNWHLCAANTLGRDKVWVRGDTTSEWNRALVLLLSNVSDRKPLMFFKNKDDIKSVALMDNVGQTIANIEKQFKEYLRTQTPPPPDFPVVAIEPDFKDGTVPYGHFYLMPIFSYDDTTFDQVLLLEVASVDPGTQGGGTAWLNGSNPVAGLGQSDQTLIFGAGDDFNLEGAIASAAAVGGFSLPALGAQNAKPVEPTERVSQPFADQAAPVLLASNDPAFLPLTPVTGSFESPMLVAQNFSGGGVEPYRLYVAFVIDTTVSMGPYIERALDISEELYIRILQEGLEEYVSLAVVAFRSSLQASPGIEYTTRIVSDFRNANEKDSFLQSLRRVREATKSTHSFSEDSFAGLETAIYDLNWPTNQQDGKVIILITDAGPLPNSDPFRATNHTPWSLGGLAKSQGMQIIPIHVKSRAGRKNHAWAEDSYRSMSGATGDYDTYIDIGADTYTYGSDTFGTAADTILMNLEQQIMAIRDYSPPSDSPSTGTIIQAPSLGSSTPSTPSSASPADQFANQMAPLYPVDGLTDTPGPTMGGDSTPTPTPTPSPGPSASSGSGKPPSFGQPLQFNQDDLQDSSAKALLPEPKISSRPNNDDPAVAKAAEVGQRIGLSIRLNYLGSVNKVTAPQVVKSWIADKDLSSLAGGGGQESKEVPTVEVAVLLTKNQLSSLSSQLKIVMEEADKALDSQSRDFFQSILSASAQIANDPQAFSLKPETKLGDLGVMGEFLEDLPYKSVIMGKTEQDWYNMSYIEQDNFIRVIKSKVDLYAQYDLDVNNWARFDQENPGDWLYRVPLTMLP